MNLNDLEDGNKAKYSGIWSLRLNTFQYKIIIWHIKEGIFCEAITATNIYPVSYINHIIRSPPPPWAMITQWI